jgi:prepilin-type N-terminal cleavage/methylation domain-containing protein
MAALSRFEPLSKGLTLIELTIVIVICAIFAIFVAQALTSSATAYYQTSNTLASQAQLHYALDRIARELREVRTVVVTAGTPQPRKFDFTLPASPTNGASKIQFTKNDGVTVTIDATGTLAGCTTAMVCMSYSTLANPGRLADISASSNLAFNFYDHSTGGSTASTGYETYTSDTANLGAVEVQLTVTASGVTSGPLKTRVSLRGTE